MTMTKPPCGDCPRKGCGEYHSKCDKYKAYKSDLKDYKAAVDHDRASNYKIVGSLMHRHGNAKTRKAAYNERYYGRHKRR